MSESHHPKVSRGPRQLVAVLPSSSLSGGTNVTAAHLAPDQARAGFRQKCNVLQGSTNKDLFTLPANSGRSRRAAHALTLTHRQPSSVPHTQVFT